MPSKKSRQGFGQWHEYVYNSKQISYKTSSLVAQGTHAHCLQRRPTPIHDNAKSGEHPCQLPLGINIAQLEWLWRSELLPLKTLFDSGILSPYKPDTFKGSRQLVKMADRGSVARLFGAMNNFCDTISFRHSNPPHPEARQRITKGGQNVRQLVL